jgi:hypothetical protein
MGWCWAWSNVLDCIHVGLLLWLLAQCVVYGCDSTGFFGSNAFIIEPNAILPWPQYHIVKAKRFLNAYSKLQIFCEPFVCKFSIKCEIYKVQIFQPKCIIYWKRGKLDYPLHCWKILKLKALSKFRVLGPYSTTVRRQIYTSSPPNDR